VTGKNMTPKPSITSISALISGVTVPRAMHFRG